MSSAKPHNRLPLLAHTILLCSYHLQAGLHPKSEPHLGLIPQCPQSFLTKIKIGTNQHTPAILRIEYQDSRVRPPIETHTQRLQSLGCPPKPTILQKSSYQAVSLNTMNEQTIHGQTKTKYGRFRLGSKTIRPKAQHLG